MIGLLFTAAIVGISIILPGKLLQRQQEGLIGKVTSIEDIHRSASPQRSNIGKQDSIEVLQKKIGLLAGKAKPCEPMGSEMNMKQAVKEGETQLVHLAALGAIPKEILDYSGVDIAAKLSTVQNPKDGFAFSYWNISYVSNPKISDVDGSLTILMDAETGKIYWIQWYAKNEQTVLNAEDMAVAFARYLNIRPNPQLLSSKGNIAQLDTSDKRFTIRVTPVEVSSVDSISYGATLSIEPFGYRLGLSEKK